MTEETPKLTAEDIKIRKHVHTIVNSFPLPMDNSTEYRGYVETARAQLSEILARSTRKVLAEFTPKTPQEADTLLIGHGVNIAEACVAAGFLRAQCRSLYKLRAFDSIENYFPPESHQGKRTNKQRRERLFGKSSDE